MLNSTCDKDNTCSCDELCIYLWEKSCKTHEQSKRVPLSLSPPEQHARGTHTHLSPPPFVYVTVSTDILSYVGTHFGRSDALFFVVICQGSEHLLMRDQELLMAYDGEDIDLDTVRMVGDRVLLRIKATPKGSTTSAAGVLIAESATRSNRPTIGVVEKVGPGRMVPSGKMMPMYVKPGDRVKYKVSEVEHAIFFSRGQATCLPFNVCSCASHPCLGANFDLEGVGNCGHDSKSIVLGGKRAYMHHLCRPKESHRCLKAEQLFSPNAVIGTVATQTTFPRAIASVRVTNHVSHSPTEARVFLLYVTPTYFSCLHVITSFPNLLFLVRFR